MRNRFLLAFLLLLGSLVMFPSQPVRAQDAAPQAADHDLQFWEALGHSYYVQEGTRGPLVYLFLEPDCPYCHVLYDWLQNPVSTGKLRLRVIIIGFPNSPSSMGKAAAILGAKDPVQALKENEKGFAIRDGAPEGGIAPASAALSQKQLGKLQRNFAFLAGKESLLDPQGVQQSGVSTPMLVYRSGKQVQYVLGLPDHQQWQQIIHGS
ncbi:thioredoxin fold domain-containing protein [Acidithiobacillus sp. AMEEHan]|uniref:thioredoxin fold domain-containing protein n=1 Tax=Acidithiobacillus sp. AMEEHan TaxID=2994951 RepID=UPI0027E51CC5|nr:thioredoxin fold domain-containing protein [Acidithiobacillus sp. AMEEHan]